MACFPRIVHDPLLLPQEDERHIRRLSPRRRQLEPGFDQ